MKPIKTKYGYLLVGLYKNKKQKRCFIHNLVAITFLGFIPHHNKIVTNHKDFDKTNNKSTNLELITQRENTNKKHITHSSKYTGGFKNEICLDCPNRY